MTTAFEFASIALDALRNELQKAGVLEDMCAVAIYPGEGVPMDYGQESCGGMAWVRLDTAHPSSAFPNADADVNKCSWALALPMEVGILRPSPIPFVEGQEIELPDDATHIEASRLQMNDMELMLRALQQVSRRVEYMLMGSYSPLGPLGGTVGGIWTFTVGD